MHPILRISGILSVFFVAFLAWLTLGGITSGRSNDVTNELSGRVADLWGRPQEQQAPTFMLEWTEVVEHVEVVTDAVGHETRKVTPRVEARSQPAQPNQTRITTDLSLDERRKGLLWFPLYNVDFAGTWSYTHEGVPRDLRLSLRFPDASGSYDGFRFVVNGVDQARHVLATHDDGGSGISYVTRVAPGDVVTLEAGYRSRGLGTWSYLPTSGVGQVEDFALTMTTDFAAIDFPGMTMSPSARSETTDGWRLDWTFDRLVTGYGIGMEMPTRLQPGELASELSFSAPISLALFFLWIYVLGLLKGTEIHPINYLFLAAAFFAFNLLFAYTADRLPLEGAFAISAVTSVFLVGSYLRLVVGTRFALLEAGIAQLLYQVGFGLAHFQEGYTGLTITVLGIVTLFALMQLTGRIRWGEVLRAPNPVPAK